MIVEIAFGFGNSKTAAEDRRDKIFRAGLAVASRDRDYLERQRFSIFGGELLIRLQGIFRADEREVLWDFSVPSKIDNRSHCAGSRGRFNKLVAIKIFAAQCHE